jgi:hypothetical protein
LTRSIAISLPSSVGRSLSVSPPSTTIRPPVVGTVGATRTRTSVPLSAAMSPVLSTSFGGSCVYAGYRY